MTPLSPGMARVEPGFLRRALDTMGALDRERREEDSFAIYDFANLESRHGSITLLMLAETHADEPTVLHYLPVSSASTVGEPVAYDSLTATETLRRIVAAQSIPTFRGNLIRLHSPSPNAINPSSIEPLTIKTAASSNSISGVTIDGRRWLHKIFRLLDPGNNEPELVRALGKDGAHAWTPKYLLSYSYEDHASGRRCPLGLVSEYFDGSSFDQVLSANFRPLWRLAALNESARLLERSVRDRVRLLAPLLGRVGRFLFEFHTALADRLGCLAGEENLPFAVARFAEGLAARAARLSRHIERDTAIPAAWRQWFARLLPTELEAALAAARSGKGLSLQAAFCHGDLHLSHLLLKPDDQDRPMRVVDLSTPCLDRHSPEFGMHCAAEDLIALQRGLEYFVSDEVCDELARILSISPEDAGRRRALAAAGQHPPQGASARTAARAERAAELWCRSVLHELMRGYFGSTKLPHDFGDGGWRLLYLARLIHELEYNVRCARPGFRLIDYYYLAINGVTAQGARRAYS